MRYIVFIVSILLLIPFTGKGQVKHADSAVTNNMLKALGGGIPKAVLKKMDSLYPHSFHTQFAIGTGEPIEHDLPDGYFKGRSYYNFSFENDDNYGYNIYMDSAANIMLLEKVGGLNPDSLPRMIRDFLNAHYYHYTVSDDSYMDYSSLDSMWWYNVSINFADNKQQGKLYFDNYCNFTDADLPELPGIIGIKFKQSYPDARDVIWDKDTLINNFNYSIHFTKGSQTFQVACDSMGHSWSEPTILGAYVPVNILDKFNSIFPGSEGNWLRRTRGGYLNDTANHGNQDYLTEFVDVRDTTVKDVSWMELDTLGNILDICHTVNYDSLPQKVKNYIKKDYPAYELDETSVFTNSKNVRTYITCIRDKACKEGNCGYWIYFDRNGNFIKKKRLQIARVNM